MQKWFEIYNPVHDLDKEESKLIDKGMILEDDYLKFNGKLDYSRFYKIISDEAEGLNDPNMWKFSDVDIDSIQTIDFKDKNSPLFSSKLVLLKFYVLRKIDEVAFVTSRYVYCPVCNSNYVIPATKIDFMRTYNCEMMVAEKKCNTTLKKFPARKMLPTYIYEIAIEVKSAEGIEYKEFFLESFQELSMGFHTGMIFGRTEPKSNSFYFTCLKAKKEESTIKFKITSYTKNRNKHKFFDIIDSLIDHIKSVGFIIDSEKARLPFMIETIKRLILMFNKEINLDHSLYFGAPGIGKTYALTLLHYAFYSNSGFITGPRFTLAGLTGGQKEVIYQDQAKKKNVPGLFSNQAFIFDEINNDTFLSDDKAINLFKAAALAPSGTSTTVGGKEFPRISLISATANYNMDKLRHYENKVKKIFNSEDKIGNETSQETFLESNNKNEVPEDFDFYAELKDYPLDILKPLKIAMLKVRDEGKNYLTNFPKPLMERFYWTVLVHPKYDKEYAKQKKVDVLAHLKSRKSIYSQRELLTRLYISELDEVIREIAKPTIELFNDSKIEESWSNDVQQFIIKLTNKYPRFFSMFHRINQVHVFCLYMLTIINNETNLSFQTKRVFEKLISLLHTPIDVEDFHNPDFDNFAYIDETRVDLLEIIKKHPNENINKFVDYENRKPVRVNLASLETNKKIKKIEEYKYEINPEGDFQGGENVKKN